MREEKLARAFVEFSDTLVRDYDVVEFLSRLCRRSVEVLEVTAAGALLTDGAKRLQVVAASTETVTVLETLQIQRQEGPCVDAFRSGRRVAVPDLRPTARRWPVFTPRALGAGVAGVCAFPMRLRADWIGALNVFQATPGALDEASVLAGQALADVATIAILQARAVEDAARLAGQLEHALESRVVVEQAKGILAERLGIDPEVAFTRLRRHCRQHGLHLAELARQVVGGSFTLDQETGQEGLAAAVDGNPVGVGSFPRSAGRPRPGARDGPATAHWDCP